MSAQGMQACQILNSPPFCVCLAECELQACELQACKSRQSQIYCQEEVC